MKRLILSVVVCLFAVTPFTARAQEVPSFSLLIDCGNITATNTSHQFGDYAWLEYIVETRRSLNTCPIAVETNAWVVDVPGSALTRAGVFSASARRQVPVPEPFYKKWQTNGKHWLIVAVLGWFELGNTVSFATINPPPELDPVYVCEV